MARNTRSATSQAGGGTAASRQCSGTLSTLASTSKSRPQVKDDSMAIASNASRSGREGSRTLIKSGTDDHDVPHHLSASVPTSDTVVERAGTKPAKKKTKLSGKGKKLDPKADQVHHVDVKVEGDESDQPRSTQTPKKKDNYGLTPGVSPYPDYPRPTARECRDLAQLLEKAHGKVVAPTTIPPPSLDISGCGEVPSVLDALVRTRLSANTTNKNSSSAFQGLVARFGTLKEGVGKGSVDWDAVRRAPQKEVFKAIERGGLADRKSKDIQAILQIAYEENQEARRLALSEDFKAEPGGADPERDARKKDEISKAEQNVISLDHLHLLSTDEAINKMLSFPGIGPKTASCVALFCLQRPSFAVDTHVFRLCQYLGWVPKRPKAGQPKVDRNTTYSHCDVRIPDDLKYPLHTLLIKHGKTCARCRAVTGQSSAVWEEGCPIEHLVIRHGAKKGGTSVRDRKRSAGAAVLDDEAEENGEDEEYDE